MSQPNALNASKLNAYAVISDADIRASKLNSYYIFSFAETRATKLNAYAVVGGQVSGTVNVTLGALTLSATVQNDIYGSVDVTLGALTLASEATPYNRGVVASELDQMMCEATAFYGNAGLRVTLDALTLSGTGTVGTYNNAALSSTLGALTLSSTGILPNTFRAAFSKTLGALTLSATGEAPVPNRASLSATFDALTLSAAGVATGQPYSVIAAEQVFKSILCHRPPTDGTEDPGSEVGVTTQMLGPIVCNNAPADSDGDGIGPLPSTLTKQIP